MQAILQYPEFLLAALIAGILLLGKSDPLTLGAAPAAAVFSVLPQKYVAWLTKNLNYAAYRSNRSIAVLASWKLYPALLVTPLAAFLPMAAVVVLAVLVFFVPDLVLVGLVRRRQADISQALPQAIDLLLLCVDAGLGFDSALARINQDTELMANPLSDELSLLSRDILLGVDRDAAYTELYTRSGVEELRIFGAALNQSSKLGLSIGGILRAHSQFMRIRQQQSAEERAAKLPVWMAFPLWFCIMPALMLILLGPSLLLFISQVHPLPQGLLN